MASDDLLDEAEINALREAAAADKVVPVRSGALNYDGPITPFEIPHAGKAVTPTSDRLHVISERFVRCFSATLLRTHKVPAEIVVEPVRHTTFAALRSELRPPVIINVLKLEPLRGVSLCIFDWRFLFTLVDRYFGGSGTVPNEPLATEASEADQRVAQQLLHHLLDDLKRAWSVELDLNPSYRGYETKPKSTVIEGLGELEKLVVTEYVVSFDNAEGRFLLVLPERALGQLDAMKRTQIESDGQQQSTERTRNAWTDIMQAVELEFSSTLLSTTISLERLLSLKPGDVIPVDMPDTVDLETENVPMLRGTCGEADGFCAIQVTGWIAGET